MNPLLPVPGYRAAIHRFHLSLLFLLLTALSAPGAPGDLVAGFQPILPGNPLTLAVQLDGKILCGGYQISSRLERNGSPDITFNQYGDTRCLLVQPDGSMLAGGSNGGSGYLAHLFADGSQDPAFNPGFSLPLDGAILCMAQQDDGRILAGGYFTYIGAERHRGMIRVNADGSLDRSFNPIVEGPSPLSVTTMTLQTSGKAVIGGDFATVGGVSRPYIARVNDDGTLDTGFTPVTDAGVFQVAVQKDDKILMSGFFTTVNGVARKGLARLNADGTLDTSFDSAPDSTILGFAVQADGKIVGNFFFNGTPGQSVVRLNPDGSRDATFHTSLSEPVQNIEIEADGSLLLAGYFSAGGGVAFQPSLLRMQNDPGISALTLDAGGTLLWTRSGAVPEVSSVIFEKRAAGAASWTRLGAGVRVAEGWNITGVTAPVTGALRALGKTAAGSLVQSLLSSGTATPLLSVQQGGQTLAAGTGEVSFGTVFGTNEHELTFNVSNTGNGPLGPLTVSFMGAGAGDFTLVRAPLSMVEPFESTAFTVRFAPAATGLSSATLNIASNAAGSPFAIHLAGEGRDRLDPSFANAAAVPLTRESFSAEGMTFGGITLAFAPAFDSVLKVIDNIGQEPIGGRFSDLPDNAIVSAVYNGQTYRFVVSYTGGTGNDLTLVRFRAGEMDTPFEGIHPELINALALQPDGKILIGGHFFGPPSRSEFARLNRDGTVDPFFNPAAGNNVNSICVQPDGKILAGGFFGTMAGVVRNRLARLSPDGLIDSGFNPNFDGPVYCISLQPDGKIIVGGSFSTVGSVPRSSLARLNANGTLDTAFNPNPVREFGALIRTIALQTDGKILIGGIFSSIGGATRNSFARLNANGSLDTAFNPSPNNDPFNGFTGSIVVQGDGKILVSGGFSFIAGSSRSGLARLNANGSIDAGFNAPSPISPSTMVVQTDGKILIGGSFTTVGGQLRRYIARLSAAGALDAGFNAGLDSIVSGAINTIGIQQDGRILIGGSFVTHLNDGYRSGMVRLFNDSVTSAMSLEADSTVHWQRGGAAQELKEVNVLVRANGTPAWTAAGMAQRVTGGWDLSGLSLPAAGGAIKAAGTTSDGSAASGLMVEALSFGPSLPGLNVQQPTGHILPAGTGSVSFGTVYGTNPRDLTFAIENAGNTFLTPLTATFAGDHPEDYSFAVAPATSLPPFERALFSVRCISREAGTRTATLRIANPVPGLNPLVIRLSSQRRNDLSPVFANAATVPLSSEGFIAEGMTFGTLTLNFAPTPGTVLTVVDNPNPYSSITGRFSDLPQGGQVKATFGGIRYTFVASYNGGTGNDLTLALFGPGTFDPGFTPNPSSYVTSLALQPDGRIFAGGYFSGIAGAGRNRFACLNTGGNIDPNFTPGAGFDATVHCLAVQPDGKVLAGGDFSTVFNSTSRNRIARLSVEGYLDPFNPDANGSVRCVLIEPDGSILIGGAFTSVGGVPRPGCAKLNEDGTLQASFNPNVTGTVLCLTHDADGKILLGGSFTSVGGTAQPFLARLASDGTLDAGFTPPVNSSVSCLAVQRDGRILIGGSFTSAGGATRNHFARLESSGALDTDLNPNVGGGSVYCMGLQADGKILIGGDFTTVSGMARSRLARLKTGGSLDSGFASGVSSTVQVIAIQANGAVLIGGSFGPPSPPNSVYLTRLGNDDATTLLEVTAPGKVRWLRSGSCPEVENATFEFVASDGLITPLGSGHRIASGWELTDVTLPPAGTLRVRGRAAGSLMESTLPVVSLSALEQWRQSHFGSPQNTGTGADNADPDKDGIMNLVEYALGLDPLLAGSSGLPQWTLTAQGLETSFLRPAAVSGVNVTAEWSASLESGWQPVPDTGSTDMHHFLVVQPDAPRLFVRISVTVP